MRRHTQLAAAALYPPIGAVPTTVPDRAGGNDGTNNGTKVALVDGRSGLDFSGENEAVQVGDVLDFSSSFSVEIWGFVREQDRSQALISKQRVNTSAGWQIEWPSFNNFAFRYRDDSGNAAFIAIGNITLNEWLHFALVVDRSSDEVRAYKNGVLEGDFDISQIGSPENDVDIMIGARRDATSSNLNGLLSDARIWNIARTQSEIQADMNKRLQGDEPGLVFYMPMQYGAHQ